MYKKQIKAQMDIIMRVAEDFFEWLKNEGEKLGVDSYDVQKIIYKLMK